MATHTFDLPRPCLHLTGQSEAGKSTLLKNFQLHFAPTAFHAEAEAWRAVIHLNLVRAVNFILEAFNSPPSTTVSSSANLSSKSSASLSSSGSHGRAATADSLRHIRMRLSPLRQVEIILNRRLCIDSAPTTPVSPTSSSQPRSSDLSVRVRSGWKALARVRRPTSSTGQDELQDARQIIDACREDIIALWADEGVRAGLRERKIALEDHCV